MKARIAIHSVPRSGSTWLGAIFDSHPNVKYAYQPLFSYAFKNYLNADATKQNILSFFQKLEESDDAFINQDETKKAGIVPEFNKMAINAIAYKEVRYHHILENALRVDSELKVVGLIRNPMATIYSWYKAPKEFRPDLGWKLNDEWRFAPKKMMEKLKSLMGLKNGRR